MNENLNPNNLNADDDPLGLNETYNTFFGDILEERADGDHIPPSVANEAAKMTTEYVVVLSQDGDTGEYFEEKITREEYDRLVAAGVYKPADDDDPDDDPNGEYDREFDPADEALDKLIDEVAALEQAEFEAREMAVEAERDADEARRSELRPLSTFAIAKPATLRRAALEGRLRAEKIGRDWLTTEDDVRKYLARGRRRRKQRRSIDLLPGLKLDVYQSHVVYHFMPRAWCGYESIDIVFSGGLNTPSVALTNARSEVEAMADEHDCWPISSVSAVVDNDDIGVYRVVREYPDNTGGHRQKFYFVVFERAASRANGRVKVSPTWF